MDGDASKLRRAFALTEGLPRPVPKVVLRDVACAVGIQVRYTQPDELVQGMKNSWNAAAGRVS